MKPRPSFVQITWNFENPSKESREIKFEEDAVINSLPLSKLRSRCCRWSPLGSSSTCSSSWSVDGHQAQVRAEGAWEIYKITFQYQHSNLKISILLLKYQHSNIIISISTFQYYYSNIITSISTFQYKHSHVNISITLGSPGTDSSAVVQSNIIILISIFQYTHSNINIPISTFQYKN